MSIEPHTNMIEQLDFEPACSVGHDHDTHLPQCPDTATHVVTGHDCTQPDSDKAGYTSRLMCDRHTQAARDFVGPLQCRACNRILDARKWFIRIESL